MNLFTAMGRLTRDPEIKYSQSGTCFGKYSLAIDRRFKREGDPDADFIDFTVFGKSAEFAEKYFTKGTKILVTAHIQNNNYEQDGVKHYGFQFIVDSQEFCESKGGTSSSRPSPETAQGFGNATAASSDGFMNIPDGLSDELPFA